MYNSQFKNLKSPPFFNHWGFLAILAKFWSKVGTPVSIWSTKLELETTPLIRPFPCDWGCQCYSYVSSTEENRDSNTAKTTAMSRSRDPRRGSSAKKRDGYQCTLTITDNTVVENYGQKGINLSREPKPFPFFYLRKNPKPYLKKLFSREKKEVKFMTGDNRKCQVENHCVELRNPE